MGLVLFCCALTSCGRSSNSDTANVHKNRLAALSRDPAIASAELMRRLQSHVTVSNDLVRFNNPILGDTAYFPINTPWSLNCGIGFGISWGSENNLDLANEYIEPKMCAATAPMVAQRLQALLTEGRSQTLPRP